MRIQIIWNPYTGHFWYIEVSHGGTELRLDPEEAKETIDKLTEILKKLKSKGIE